MAPESSKHPENVTFFSHSLHAFLLSFKLFLETFQNSLRVPDDCVIRLQVKIQSAEFSIINDRPSAKSGFSTVYDE